MSTVAPFFGKRGSATDTQAQEYIKAAQKLFHTLHQGFVGTGVHRVPIAGDTTKLPFANGLSALDSPLRHGRAIVWDPLDVYEIPKIR